MDTSILEYIPKRIISLVPSQTELLHSLGLENETVGITRFCIHPNNWYITRTRVGGTKSINIPTVYSLQPDLVIANKEENIKEQVEEIAMKYPVWVTDVNDLEGAMKMIKDIGDLTGKQRESAHLIEKIIEAFLTVSKIDKVKTCYLIWKDPYMTIGGDTFINDMLGRAGFENVFAGKTRYPETGISEIRQSECRLVLLSSEPYPFKQKHIKEMQEKLPECKIILVNGEMFSWYGSRLLQAPAYFRSLAESVR